MSPAPEEPPASGDEGFTDFNKRFVMLPQLNDPGIQRIPRLMVDELYIGDGLLLRWSKGTHGLNGRLSLEGVGANACEIQILPGPDCKTGIASQIMIFGHFIRNGIRAGFTRWSITQRKQSDGSPITTVGSDSKDISTPPTEFVMGGQTFSDGSDDGGRTLLLSFESGQVDVVNPNGSRTVIRQPGGVPADPR